MPRPYRLSRRPTAATFVVVIVSMNSVDVVDLVVDLVDVDLDVDLVDVVSLSSGCILIFAPRLFFNLLAPRQKNKLCDPRKCHF